MRELLTISGFFKVNDERKKGYLTVDKATGLIAEVRFEESTGALDYHYGEEYTIEMGDFNAHSHPEQSLYTDMVDKSWDLPTWCRNTIYKFSPLLTEEHVYLACCRAFSRMLAHGVTSVMVSFYCHNNRGNQFDHQVIRAAVDTGIRLYFGRMNYDMVNEQAYEAKKKSQLCYFETPLQAEKYFIELVEEIDYPNVVVAPSAHSIHASTKEAIVRAINLGNRYDRYVQFHLSEDEGDVTMSLDWYGLRPIEFLVDLLKKGEVRSLKNLLLSDCIWIDDTERALIKEYGMQVVLNPRMNARIKAGEAQLPLLLDLGIDPYLGTDGEASNDDLSVTGERAFLRERFHELKGETIEALGRQPFPFKDGYIGEIAVGHYCDLKVMQGEQVVDVFVGGRLVVSHGQLQTLDVVLDVEEPLQKLLGAL